MTGRARFDQVRPVPYSCTLQCSDFAQFGSNFGDLNAGTSSSSAARGQPKIAPAPMDEPAIERAFAAAQFGTYQWRLLIIAGVGWMTDGMEMYVMALILPLLASEMELSADALGMMGGGVFMGMGAGAYFGGFFTAVAPQESAWARWTEAMRSPRCSTCRS